MIELELHLLTSIKLKSKKRNMWPKIYDIQASNLSGLNFYLSLRPSQPKWPRTWLSMLLKAIPDDTFGLPVYNFLLVKFAKKN